MRKNGHRPGNGVVPSTEDRSSVELEPVQPGPLRVTLRRPIERLAADQVSRRDRDMPADRGGRWLVAPLGSVRAVVVDAHTAFDACAGSGLSLPYSAVVVRPFDAQAPALVAYVGWKVAR